MVDVTLAFDALGGKEAAKSLVKGLAYNKAFDPPDDDVLLMRQVIWSLKNDRNKWREEAIAAKKEISALKRGGQAPSGPT